MIKERTGLIVWISDLKSVKHLERYGNIHYISRKMFYVVLYMDSDQVDHTMKQLQKQPFVKKIERSYRNEIKTEYNNNSNNNNIPDKAKFYTL